MRLIRKTILEAILILVVGTAVGFTANAARAKRNSIRFDKDYFKISVVVPPAEQMSPNLKEDQDATGSEPAAEPGAGQGDQPESAPGDGHEKEDSEAGTHADHPFQKITLEEVASIFCDPSTEQGVNIFLDARSDALFEEGHIPGAIQCDRYRFEEYIDTVVPACQTAEKIIVYCHGGDCEDSILLCCDLMDADVPYDRLCVFAGGWTEWKDNQMPVEEGER
ncbi:MAG: rhodanese-like domain-containing protein [Phycisphaerales bacterium]|nr:MAG: rhodanese-like domain-containing protein [Phycisphaerales bacterium]